MELRELPFYVRIFIPPAYYDLARTWGLPPPYGPIIAFFATAAMIFGIIWMGLLFSFGKIMQGNENLKRALIIISVGIAGFAAYGLAEVIAYGLSWLIYLIVGYGILTVLRAIRRALTAGYEAAEATIYEARALKERAMRLYEKQRVLRESAARQIIKSINSSIELALKKIKDIKDYIEEKKLSSSDPVFGSVIIPDIHEIEKLLNNAKEEFDTSKKYNTLLEVMEILKNIESNIKTLAPKFKDEFLPKIEYIKKTIRTALSKADEELKKLISGYSKKK